MWQLGAIIRHGDQNEMHAFLLASQVFAENAHKNFSRGNVGDHIALMNCYDGWVESNYSTQWCYENYVQVRREPGEAVAIAACALPVTVTQVLSPCCISACNRSGP